MIRGAVRRFAIVAFVCMIATTAGTAASAGDAGRGARAFGACAACHSLEPERSLTGPSLSGVWGRKAGSLDGFARYSRALKESGLVWNEQTLDRWLRDPAA